MSTAAVVTDPELNSEALSVVERATSLTVLTNESREIAAEMGRGIAGLIARATEWFSPMKHQAAQAHKTICAKENEVIEPLERAKRYLSSQIGSYDQAQERLRRAEEVAAQEKARQYVQLEAYRIAQENAINDAIALEAVGDKTGAEAVLAHPAPVEVYVPPVVIPRTVSKTAGVTPTQIWKFTITNVNLIPREYLEVDEKRIGQVVRAMKDKTSIPGIKAYPEGAARFRA